MWLKQPITTTSPARARAPARRPPTRTAQQQQLARISSGARRRTGAALAAVAANEAPLPTTSPLALKEWAVTIDALLAGEQVLLLRKGGLLDGKFRLEAREFLLFPTTFHVKDQGLLTSDAETKFSDALALPEPKTLEGVVPLKCRVRVQGAWSVVDGRVVAALSDDPGLHVWGPAFTEARLKWKPGAPMTLALVRAYALDALDAPAGAPSSPSPPPPPLRVRQRADYYGCFSWARVEPLEEKEEGDWRPVLSDEEFERRGALVRERLRGAGIEATPLELPTT
jgi:hypothetical protein